MIFNKIKVGGIKLNNRIVVSPMCQYSGKNGCPSEWHYAHLGNLANSGAGMLTIESTAVNMNGRITHADLYLSCLLTDILITQQRIRWPSIFGAEWTVSQRMT